MGKKDNPPDCYGTMWDGGDPLCAGGHDPSYLHPVRKDRVRDACDYFTSCATRKSAAQQGQYIPAQNLVRNYQQPHQPGFPAQAVQQPMVLPVQQQQQQMPMGMQQMMPVNYQMPGYLSAQEDPGQNSLGKRLFLYGFRSMAKALFHGLSHFFDVNAFGAAPRLPPPPAAKPENKETT